jgi:hypothetical protein
MTQIFTLVLPRFIWDEWEKSKREWEELIREIKKNPRPHFVVLILPTALLVLHWLLWG